MAKASSKTKSSPSKKSTPASKRTTRLVKASLVAVPSPLSRPATINITFASGLGQATAALFRQGNMINMQTTSISANINFSDVESGDVIGINGVATGNVTIVIDVPTNPPTPTVFGAGPFNIIYGVL